MEKTKMLYESLPLGINSISYKNGDEMIYVINTNKNLLVEEIK